MIGINQTEHWGGFALERLAHAFFYLNQAVFDESFSSSGESWKRQCLSHLEQTLCFGECTKEGLFRLRQLLIIWVCIFSRHKKRFTFEF